MGDRTLFRNPIYYTIDSDWVLYMPFWSGVATDRSSYGNNGTLVGSPSFVENGIQLNGSSQYISLPTSDSLNFTTSDRSYFAWIYTTSQSEFLKMIVSYCYIVMSSIDYNSSCSILRITIFNQDI